MLDADPSDTPNGDTPTGDTPNGDTPNGDTPSAPAADAQAPPVKAPRRRRATKATAAPPESAAPAAPAAPAESAGDEPAGSTGVGSDLAAPAVPAEGGVSAAGETPGYTQDGPADEAPAAPAKRTRKAAAKKAAPRKRTAKAPAEALTDAAAGDPVAEAAVEVLTTPAEPVVEAVEQDPAVAQSTSADVVPEALVEAAEAAPEVTAPSRTRRRRAPAVVTFQAPEPDPVPAIEEPADEQGEPAAPRRRRRAGTSGALSPSALLPTLLAPAPPAPASAADEEEEPDSEDVETEHSVDDDRPRRRRRGRRGRGPRRDEGDEPTAEGDDETAEAPADDAPAAQDAETPEPDDETDGEGGTRRRRRRRRRGGSGGAGEDTADEVPTVVHVREPRQARVRGASAADEDGVRGITGSTRMAAKRARRQEGRDSGRRRTPILSEAEFLARREAVDRAMVVRQQGDRTQIAVLEDGVLVEHYVTKASAQAFAGNVYLGKVQNVLPSMEAAFIDIGKGKNGVLYAGEVNYDAQLAGSGPRKIEQVLKSGQDVLVQVSKDPIGHKGARLTSQVSLPGRYLVYVPEGTMTGISRKLPETERNRLKAILKQVVPEDAGVIIRTAAEGASEQELAADVRRLQAQWEVIQARATATTESGGAPVLLHAEPDLLIRVVRDVFNEDFTSMVVQGDSEWDTIREYVEFVAPDLAPRLSRHDGAGDVFAALRIDEQLAKALDRKVWLPSGGSLVIDRTEAMVVIDVNTGKYVGKGGNLEETVTRNNLEAAEEIARQLRLRDLGGIIVVDFIDMVLESNRDLVVRRLAECLGRDRTKHQVAEVTSLGLVQMTRKRVGQGLLESFSETCEACQGRGVLVTSAKADAKAERAADRGDERRDRKPRGNGAEAAAAVAAIAKASLAEPRPAPVTAPAQTPAAGTADAEPDAEQVRGRRRRGGRGAGAAAAAAATASQAEAAQAEAAQAEAAQAEAVQAEAAQVPVLPEGDDPADTLEPEQAAPDQTLPDAAPLVPADVGPDLVPEVAEQPTPGQEDVPVLPEVVGSVLDPEPGASVPADPEQLESGPVDVTEEPAPEVAPEPVVIEAPEPAPRRRRRATSRPAGPPAAE